MLENRFIFYSIGGVAICFLQQLLFDRLAIYGLPPDFVTIYVVFLAMREGQSFGTTSGFLSGLLLGLLTGTLGPAAFAKSVEGFVGGYFTMPDERNLTKHFLNAILVASFLGNVSFFLIMLSKNVSFLKLFFFYGATGSLYNTLIAYVLFNIGLKRFFIVR
ncbi:rod shape-determining protein MreD [Chloroherpeton thalassium ATCC 35110]|uniref:Rod shape-determining protein MreD n=1 Tax=Chloroherpeton thalassium (strain ATCC 35110 / GB-78) TaxID=517418 RepID=B3QX62_CHLT3|nr:rod shape-determining protein MreD [Chloroherpeton thalassium]ACF14872.1 rod shape-determining protein MreD [Chloroherpeton thalassium ATCC 35110]